MREPLHFNQSAPLRLPLPLLLIAPLFGCAAMLLALLGLPEIMASRWNPALIAAVHLFTLGFLGCTMLAAVLQILPVLSGKPPLRNRFLIRLIQTTLISGVILFACGMLGQHPGALRAAAVLLAISVFAWLVLAWQAVISQSGMPTRFRNMQAFTMRPAVAGILLALAGFGIAAALGLRLLAGWGFSAISLPRQLTDIHAGWAMLGWVAPLIFAVSLEVVPMFQFTRPLPAFARWLPALLISGMLFATFPATRTIGFVWTAICLLAGAAVILERQWRRPHGIPDATFQLFRVAMLSVIASVILFFLPDSLFVSGDARRILFILLFLAGFAGSCVMGMLLKIVPFLVRLHLQRELWLAGIPARTLPAFNRMASPWLERGLWPAQAAGLLLLAAGFVFDWQIVLQAGLFMLCAAMCLCAMAAWQVALTGRRVRGVLHTHASEGGVA